MDGCGIGKALWRGRGDGVKMRARRGALPACYCARCTASLRARSMNFGYSAIALCALMFAPLGQAQTTPTPSGENDEITGKFDEMPMSIDADKFGSVGRLVTFTGNVQISRGGTTIYCDEAIYDGNTREAIVSGNVRIYRDGRLVTADRAVYNLETRDITAATVRGDTQPFVFSGSSFQNIPGSNGYLV